MPMSENVKLTVLYDTLLSAGPGNDQWLTANGKMSGWNGLIWLAISRKWNRGTREEIQSEKMEQSPLMQSVEGLCEIPIYTNVPE